MRLRLPLGRAALFLAALAFALVALLPLRVAAGWFGLDGRGLSAREASGSLWSGALKEARFGPVPLGDVRARLELLPLLLGRARLRLSRDEAQGRLDGAVTRVAPRLRRRGSDRPGPARRAVRARAAGDARSRRRQRPLRGRAVRERRGPGPRRPRRRAGGRRASAAPRAARKGRCCCRSRGQSGVERLDLRIRADGRWRIEAALGPIRAADRQAPSDRLRNVTEQKARLHRSCGVRHPVVRAEGAPLRPLCRGPKVRRLS